MTAALSSRPDLDQIKRQAKELLKAQKSGNSSACEKLRKVQRFASMSNAEILSADIKLSEAQHAVAKDYGFNTWSDLKQHVLKAGEKNLLHIHCGDHSADILRQGSVGGEVMVWHDPVLEGPVPGRVSDQEYREVRARFFVDQQYTKSYEGALQGLTARHDKLAQAKNYAEVVLWFDACLFDQTIMIHLIEKLAQTDTGNAKTSLICVGEHPEFKRFVGLGELNPAQMAALFPGRHEITPAEKELAVKAWKAFSSDNPRAIEDLLQQDCSALPYLADALKRHLEQYPSVTNGLNRLQREALEVVASGMNKLGQIFSEVSQKEERPFFGDTILWECLDEMAGGNAPLLKIDGPGPLKSPLWEPIQKIERWSVALTSTGQDVLSDNADFVKLNGIDRWLGGVHLQDLEARWRWDAGRGQLIAMRGAPQAVAASGTDAPDSVAQTVDALLMDAHRSRASDIHLEWIENKLRARYRIDGKMAESPIAIPADCYQAIIDHVKKMSALDVADHGKPQVGMFMTIITGRKLSFRVSVVPYISGETVVIRIFDEFQPMSLDKQGWSNANLAIFRKWIRKPNGLIIVTGPFGAGRTTAMYGMLKELNPKERNILTIEDPVEYRMEGIRQMQLDFARGITCERAIREQMRQDPDVVMVSTCSDLPTLEAVVTLATTGHLALTAMHSQNGPACVRRVLDVGIRPYLINKVLIGVAALRLVRLICSHCKEEYEPKSWERDSVELGTSTRFFRGRGCELCLNTGYRGKTAIHEMMEIDDASQNAIGKGVSEDDLRRVAILSGMKTLKQDGLSKAAQGITTVDEVFRVCG